jgi:hypothetical protein
LPLERRRSVFVQETKSLHVGQHALDGARAVVGARAAVGVFAAARADAARAASARAIIAAAIAAATGADEPAPPKPDIAEGTMPGDDGRRAQARTPSSGTCALQKRSGSLVHWKAEPRLEHIDQLEHARWG